LVSLYSTVKIHVNEITKKAQNHTNI